MLFPFFSGEVPVNKRAFLARVLRDMRYGEMIFSSFSFRSPPFFLIFFCSSFPCALFFFMVTAFSFSQERVYGEAFRFSEGRGCFAFSGRECFWRIMITECPQFLRGGTPSSFFSSFCFLLVVSLRDE